MFGFLFVNLILVFIRAINVYKLQNQVANLTKSQVDIFLFCSFFSILSFLLLMEIKIYLMSIYDYHILEPFVFLLKFPSDSSSFFSCV